MNDNIEYFLKDYLTEEQESCFQIKPHYNIDGNLIQIFWKKEPYYAEWIDFDLTLYKSQETDQVIGCEICNIEQLLKMHLNQ